MSASRRAKRLGLAETLHRRDVESCEPMSSVRPQTASAQDLVGWWAPVVLWIGFILVASGDFFSSNHTAAWLGALLGLVSVAPGDGFEAVNLMVRKTAHLVEYGMLGLLSYRAFQCTWREWPSGRWWTGSAALVIACAIIDELHQSTVASRTGSFRDVLVDTAGASLGMVLFSRLIAPPVGRTLRPGMPRLTPRSMRRTGALARMVGVERAQRLSARRQALLEFEREYWCRGVTRIGGVDEVGVGPLAGPLVAAAVILPPELSLCGIDDSKKLSANQRERLAREIEHCAVALGIGIVEAAEVDRLNAFWASVEAMRRAVRSLAVDPEQLLVDARCIPGLAVPQRAIVKGDSRSYSIAAASILAKVTRDGIMRDLDRLYPEYGFARHMGYGTPFHLDVLARLGPSPIHRRSFLPVVQPRLPGF